LTLFLDRVKILIPVVSFILFFVFPLDYHFPKSSSGKFKTLRIITCNLGKGSLENFLKWAKFQEADLIFMQEIYHVGQKTFDPLFPEEEWTFKTKNHMGILSRYEIIDTESKTRRQFDGWGAIAEKIILRLPDRTLTIFNIHLESPREGIQAVIHGRLSGIPELKRVTNLQYKESELISTWAKETGAEILAGDFNLPRQHPLFQKYWSLYTHTFSESGQGFGHTKYTRLHGVTIDHILTTKNWIPQNTTVSPPLGGDHRALITDLVYKGEDI